MILAGDYWKWAKSLGHGAISHFEHDMTEEREALGFESGLRKVLDCE